MFGSGIRLGNVCCTLAGYVIVRVVDPSQPDGFFLTRRAAGRALTYTAPGWRRILYCSSAAPAANCSSITLLRSTEYGGMQ